MVFEGDAIAVRAGVAFLGCLEGNLFGVETQADLEAVLNKGLDEGLGEAEWISMVKGAGKS